MIAAAAGAHLLGLVVGGIGLTVWILGLIIAIGEVKTPTPDGAETANLMNAVGLVLLALSALLLAAALVLDVLGVVMSAARLPGSARAAPIYHLVVVGSTAVLAAGLLIVWLLGIPDGGQLGLLIPALFLTSPLWALVLPGMRIAQFVVGIVRAAQGDPADT